VEEQMDRRIGKEKRLLEDFLRGKNA